MILSILLVKTHYQGLLYTILSLHFSQDFDHGDHDDIGLNTVYTFPHQVQRTSNGPVTLAGEERFLKVLLYPASRRLMK